MGGYGKLVLGLLCLIGLVGCNQHSRGYGGGYRPYYGGGYNRSYDNRARGPESYQYNRGNYGSRGGWSAPGPGGGGGSRGGGGPPPGPGAPPANHPGN